jgi:methyl coenzyme M reductase beta subunit
VQASVEMAAASFAETAVCVSMVGELERKIMGKEFSEQAVIDGALSDLLVAYELTLEIARHSSGENIKRARAAAALLDVCFQNFSHFGTKSAVGLLEGQMEKLRLLPLTPVVETPMN